MLALNKKQKTIKIITITVIIIIFLMAKTKAKAINKTDKKLNPLFYIDPFIGTDAHGHTFPGATTPFGMVQLSPDTDTKGWGHCSGYHYKDSSIMGFSHTHLSGTGCMDYGNILFMPIVGEIKTEPGPKNDPSAGYRSSFKHKTEKANPGYYSVFLDDYKVGVELTATKRVGVHRYTFPYSKRAHILIDLIHRIGGFATEAEVNIIDNQTIQSYSYCDQSGGGWCASGVKYRVFFVAKFSKPFSSFGTWDNKGIYLENRRAKIIYKKMGLKRSPDTTSNETAMNFQEKRPKLGAFLTFNTKKNEKIVVKVGTSFSSVEGARKNLEKEVADSDFDAIKLKAKALWNKELTKLEIKGGAKKDLRTFYTALYHCLIAPNIFSDIDGTYIGIDQKMHKIKDYPHYSVFSLWDTFRAEHPLFALLYPKYDLEMLKSLLDKYDQGGWLPIWELACNYTNCMIGDHSIPIIVDAYTKGIRDFDIDKAYKAMKKGAMELPPSLSPICWPHWS
jgi:predicted alpha-1,2-mannosidase